MKKQQRESSAVRGEGYIENNELTVDKSVYGGKSTERLNLVSEGRISANERCGERVLLDWNIVEIVSGRRKSTAASICVLGEHSPTKLAPLLRFR